MSIGEKTILSNQGGTSLAEPVSGLLPVIAGGFQSPVSTGNSTTTATDAFTGASEQNIASDVMVSCYSDDQAGILHFDFSANGTDWRTFPSSGFTVSAGIHEFHTAVKGPRYFRVRWESDTAPTTLQIFTYYGNFRQPSAPLNQSQGRDADCLLTRPSSWQDEISIGLRGGISQFNKFAHRPDLDTADGDAFIIADSATNSPELLTSAETFDIAYDNTTDGSGQAGALTLALYYIDSDGSAAVSVHTLGGTGSDTTSFSGFGINRIAVSSSGSTATNGNAITVTSTTTGGVQGYLPTGEGVTQQAIYFTPADARAVAKSLYINVNKISGGGSPVVTIKGWVWNRNIATKFEIFRTVIDTGVENTVTFTDACNFPLNPTDALWFTAETDTNNTTIGALRFSLNVIDNA